MTTKDTYAAAIIAEGQRRGITERGIVIALATTLVETNLIMYANSKVPESLALPHEAVGFDGMSVGLFQQQVVQGAGGQWWWGDAKTCMDPTLSAGLFYDRLARLDYNNPARSPGSYAQAVQQSAYPDRYDQRMGDAQAIYNRLASTVPQQNQEVGMSRPDYNEYAVWSPSHYPTRQGNHPYAFLLHTEEPPVNAPDALTNDNAADQLARNVLANPANQVSYHYSISQARDGGVTVVDCVDTDQPSWSVGDANNISINLCFAGSRASWSRDQWLKQAKAIDVAAYLAVQDCQKYGMSTLVVPPPYTAGKPGISDHRWVTQVFGWGTHTDVGDSFPWDMFAAAVAKYAAVGHPAPVPTPPAPAPAPRRNPPAIPKPATETAQVGQVWDQQLIRWDFNGGRTNAEMLGAIGAKLGIPGCYDPLETH